MEDPAFWGEPDRAREVMRERTRIENALDGYLTLAREMQDNRDLIELGEAEDDEEIVDEAEAALLDLRARAARMETESLLSGEADSNDSFVEIHAGAGGTESQDWAEMLARMYTRWAEAHGYSVEVLEESLGEEAGVEVGHDARQGARTPMAGSRPRAACTVWSGFRPSMRVRAGIPASPRSGPIR